MTLTLTPSTVAPGGRMEYDAPPDAQLPVGYKYRTYIDDPSNGTLSNGGRIRKDGIHNALNVPTTEGTHLLAIQTQAKPNGPWVAAVAKSFTVAKPAPSVPVISGVGATDVTQTTANVRWHVSPPSSGQVDYGMSTLYGKSTTPEPNAYADHIQAISGLTPDTTYYFRVRSPLDGSATAAGTFRTLASAPTPDPTPTPPSGDLPPPPSGQDAAALIMATLAQRSVRLQSGATYVCKQPITLPNSNVLDLNGATLLWTSVSDGIRGANKGSHTVGGGTLQGAYKGGPGSWADSNHGVTLNGGGGHKFPDLWVRDFQGDAYYLAPSWVGSTSTSGTGVTITGGGFKHVGRMGLGIVAFDGGYVADWTAEDCYTPLDFEPDPSPYGPCTTRHWVIERVKIRGAMNGSDGSGSKWLNLGSPQRQSAAYYQRIEDIEVRYCDIDVTSPTSPHNAMGTDNDGAHYRAKDLRIHHNVVHQTYYRGGLFEHVDGLVLTDNVTPVRSSPWAVINDCTAVTDARNG